MPANARSDQDDRRRIEEQIGLMQADHPDQVAWDSDEDRSADFTFLYDPDVLLVRTTDQDAVIDVLDATGDFATTIDRRPEEDGGNIRTFPPDDSGRAPVELIQLLLPGRNDGNDRQRVPLAMDAIDAQGLNDDEERQVAAPDHWMHLCLGGGTRLCPAVEPTETGLPGPWPGIVSNPSLGEGVLVVVVDSGWHAPAAQRTATSFLQSAVNGDADPVPTPTAAAAGAELPPYAGHGTFIAGVIKCLAPSAEVFVERFISNSFAIRESAMVRQLRQALERKPQIINLSAGAVTRKHRPLLSFEVFHEQDLSTVENCLVVAAAGNDGTSDRFWPAAFKWTLGVGSLDHDGRVSSFSNYGRSADVFALGRNLVNAYPDGRFVCREAPETQDVRNFDTGLARWSGTSFAAPVVAGLIAAAITGGGDVHQARNDLVDGATSPGAVDPDGTNVPAVPPASL